MRLVHALLSLAGRSEENTMKDVFDGSDGIASGMEASEGAFTDENKESDPKKSQGSSRDTTLLSEDYSGISGGKSGQYRTVSRRVKVGKDTLDVLPKTIKVSSVPL